MEKKYTPGPWTITIRSIISCGHIQIADASLGKANTPYSQIKDEEEANAQLISAAPDLLEALIAVVAVADRRTIEFDKAKAAIAKAIGGI